MLINAGTNAKIDVQLYSETSSSARYRLSAYDTEQPILKRGNKDMFLVYTQAPLGKMSHVVINQKGKGKKAKWHLDNIKLYDPLEEQEWTFPCNIWLKPAHNGGEETHCVCFQSEQTRTSWLFNTITSNLLQFHLWVNAVFGGPREHPCILSRPLTVLTLFSLYVNYLLGNILLTVAFPQPASGEKQLVSGDLFIIAFGVHFVIKLLNCLVEFTLCNTVTKRLCWMYDILNMDPLGWTDKPDTGGGGRISMARQACRDAPPDDEEAFILSGDADIPASVGVEDDTMVSISHGQYLVEAEIHHGASPSEVLDTADIPVELTYTACGGEQKLEEFKPSAIPKVARGSVSAKDSQLNLSNTLLVDKPQPLLSAWQPSDMPFEEMDEMPTKALSSHAIISPIPPSAGPGKRQRRHTMVFNREEMPFSRQVSLASKTELMRQNLAKKRLGHMDVETSTARVTV
ncbi:uncharacterized protein LOC106179264 [Lingula anatina]|uniref:Uncharacterized protein LOC106179264 n=1 Tax=Lingula anatina TaxID=7574 RepID=A0A1S3K6Y8_LINAN|nr:uncharacterized protein LOC106179264 [Lingula anatina]|eukprot:XP_013418262.1 uncharacterized protein LOC106179264 [Lingula anatina]